MITNVDKEMQIDYKSEAGDADWLPVDGYLQKPVEPKTLLARVREIL